MNIRVYYRNVFLVSLINETNFENKNVGSILTNFRTDNIRGIDLGVMIHPTMPKGMLNLLNPTVFANKHTRTQESASQAFTKINNCPS